MGRYFVIITVALTVLSLCDQGKVFAFKRQEVRLCDDVPLEDGAFLSSPGYTEGRYPNSLNWCAELDTGHIPHGSNIQLMFCDFQLEYDAYCVYDSVRISHGLLNRGCGSSAFGQLFNVEKTPNLKLRISLHTDTSVRRRGFNLAMCYGRHNCLPACPQLDHNKAWPYSPGYYNSTTTSASGFRGNDRTTQRRRWTPHRDRTTPRHWPAPSQWTTPRHWTAPSQWTTPRHWTAPSQWTTPRYWTPPRERTTPRHWTAPRDRTTPRHWTAPLANWTSPSYRWNPRTAPLQCDSIQLENGVYLQNPGYGLRWYDNNMNWCLNVRLDHVARGEWIRLRFCDMHVAYDPTCRYDWVSVTFIGSRICGNDFQWSGITDLDTIYSIRNTPGVELTVSMVTDDWHGMRGFLIATCLGQRCSPYCPPWPTNSTFRNGLGLYVQQP